MITVLLGSSGSGKSYVGYQLLANFPHETVMWPPRTPPNKNRVRPTTIGYTLPGGLFILGSYTARVCGGADSISGGFPKVQLPFIERAAHKFTHIFIESLMGSLCKPAYWSEATDRLVTDGAPSLPFIFPTMNTPKELCLQRIYDRNGGKQINEDATNSNWRRVQRQRARIEALGFYAPYVDYTRSYEHVLQLLEWGGWRT